MLCALLAAAALLGGMQAFVEARLPGRLPFYAAHAMSFKVNGNVVQRAAFRTPDELPVYGSSELDLPISNRPDAFFRDRPTGFAVFPVGRGGATSLIILQKLAAVGDAARGKRVVIILSSTWFLQPALEDRAVAANLAGSQLSAWLFGSDLSPGLKRDIARRLRDYSDDFNDQTLLGNAVESLARPTPWNRLRFALLYPLGKLQNALLERLDYGVLLWEMVFPQQRFREDHVLESCAARTDGGHIDWNGFLARVEADPGEVAPRPPPPAHPGAYNDDFFARLNASREFEDVKLLVRVLKELNMQACFICQPFNGAYSDLGGITPDARHAHYDRLESLLQASGYPLYDFPEHEEDPLFFSDEDHPSAKAWIFYDREINRFYEEGKR